MRRRRYRSPGAIFGVSFFGTGATQIPQRNPNAARWPAQSSIPFNSSLTVRMRGFVSGGRPCRPPDIDLAGLYVHQQRLQRRSLQCPARETSVIIVGFDELPALLSLALDIGFRGFALGIERVEVLFEPMLGGFAGIDDATKGLPLISRHGGSPTPYRSPRACRRSAAHSTSCR